MQIDASDLSRKIIQSLEDYWELIKSLSCNNNDDWAKGIPKEFKTAKVLDVKLLKSYADRCIRSEQEDYPELRRLSRAYPATTAVDIRIQKGFGTPKYTGVKPCVDAIISEWKIIKSLDDLSRSLSHNKQLGQGFKKDFEDFSVECQRHRYSIF
jgi:hypothetical protein